MELARLKVDEALEETKLSQNDTDDELSISEVSIQYIKNIYMQDLTENFILYSINQILIKKIKCP